MKLSANFDHQEIFGEHMHLLPEQVQTAFWLANLLLQPTRDRWGPLKITSGYRPPAENAAVGGVAMSAHQFIEHRGAVDFQPVGFPGHPRPSIRSVFDWIRSRPLPFHRLGLEVNKDNPEDETRAAIHIEIGPAASRIVFVGYTRGGPYFSVSRGAFGPDEWPVIPAQPYPPGPWNDLKTWGV